MALCHPALPFECHPQHPSAQGTDLLPSSHQKWKLEHNPDSSNAAYFLVLFWSLFTFAGEKAEGFFLLLLLLKMLLKLHRAAEITCLSGPCQSNGRGRDWHSEDGDVDIPVLFYVILQAGLKCHLSKALQTIPALDMKNIRHFSRLLSTWLINTECFGLLRDLKKADKEVFIFVLLFIFHISCQWIMEKLS